MESTIKYECDVCAYIYKPENGEKEGGIPAGTPWAKIPRTWTCPICGSLKETFLINGQKITRK